MRRFSRQYRSDRKVLPPGLYEATFEVKTRRPPSFRSRTRPVVGCAARARTLEDNTGHGRNSPEDERALRRCKRVSELNLAPYQKFVQQDKDM